MFHREALRSSIEALRANKFRAFLTALGLVIGNASVILVVTISLTSRDYILDQIQRIGSNLIYAQYEAATTGPSRAADADYIKTADVEAVREKLGSRIVAATGVMNSFDRMRIAGQRRRRRDHRHGRVLSGSAQPGSARRPVLRWRRRERPGARGAGDGKTGACACSAGRKRRSARPSSCTDFQFTVIGTFRERDRKLRAVRADGRQRADPDHGAANFSRRSSASIRCTFRRATRPTSNRSQPR